MEVGPRAVRPDLPFSVLMCHAEEVEILRPLGDLVQLGINF